MALKKLLECAVRWLAAVALFAIMWLTLIDVSGRKLLSESVPGSLEVTELLMVVVIFAGLPLVSPALASTWSSTPSTRCCRAWCGACSSR